MIQIVKFPTWSRIVGLTEKKSVLDHVYVTDPSVISELEHIKPCFGDHELLTMKFNAQPFEQLTYWRRDWRKYIEKCLVTLLFVNFV